MTSYMKRSCKKAYKFYNNELSNFKTVLKDTNNNLLSADRFNYNCMSYALGVYNKWLGLSSFDYSIDYDNEDSDIDYDYLKHIFEDCCQELIWKYDLRRLSSSREQLEANERMIAFRIGADDFHFARKNSDGTWTHKPGQNYIRKMHEKELLSDSWSEDTRIFPYVSEIAFFAVKI